jgi:acetate---CoA ligase (ADP-forming)
MSSQVQQANTAVSSPDAQPNGQLSRLFRSSHIALVGASDTSRFMRQIVENNEQLGYTGQTSMVNPRHEQALGRRCYPRLSALPQVPDSVVISVPAMAVPAIVDEGLELGIRSFVVHSAGFAEHGSAGEHWQAALLDSCQAAGAALIGPNCMGAISLSDGVALSGMPLPLEVTPGHIAVVAQSGSAATTLTNSGRGLRFSYVVSSGNEAVTTTEDLITFLIEDPDTRMILAFTEGFKQPRRLVEIGRQALAAGKPIVLLKTGMTVRSSQIARSHTGALAGSAEALVAAMEVAGISLVRDFDEMVETAVLLSSVPKPPARARTAIITNSGGETSLTADVAEATGLELASYSPTTATRLREVFELPGQVQATSPMDSGMGSVSSVPFRERLRTALELWQADPGVDVIVFAIDLNRRASPAAGAVDGLAVLTSVARGSGKVFAVLSHTTSGGIDEHVVTDVRAAGIPVLLGTRQALLAIRHLGEYGRAVRSARPLPERDPSRVRAVLPLAPPAAVVGELGMHPVLDEYGIAHPAAALATSAAQAAAIGDRLGYPVVLKVVSPDIVHKSRVGGVVTGVEDRPSAESAYSHILQVVAAARPQARLDGVMVAARAGPGEEFILGARDDRDFGPVVVFGRGGVHVEELREFATALAPLTEERAGELYASIVGRDAAPGTADRDDTRRAVIAALIRFSQLAADAEGLYDEMEINPLIVSATGAVAADARMLPTIAQTAGDTRLVRPD